MVVDDHPVVRQGLAIAICREPDLKVCGEAEHIEDALRVIAADPPDLVIVDLVLEGEDGLELISRIKSRWPAVKTLVYSVHDEQTYAGRALRAGAMGFISKREEASTIITAIRQVLAGEVYLSNRMTLTLLQRATVGKPLDHNPAESLSKRELQVFELLGQGMSMVEIARRLEVSPKTVESHRKVIKAKLNLPTAAQLSRRAFQWVQEQS